MDLRILSTFLSDRLNLDVVELVSVDVKCAWPVFKATAANGAPLFVKLANPAFARQTREFLSAMPALSFLPRVILTEPFDFDGYDVLVLEWKEAKCVNAEDMSDKQFVAFAEGCKRLSAALSVYRGPVREMDEDDPEFQYGKVFAYAARHPLVGWLLRPLLDIPERERTYADRCLVTIHGDFQPKNYGFDGERFAAVFDFDALTTGLACEDAAYAFTERARRAELSSAKRRRLTELFLRLVEMSPWPKDEWIVAVNHARLRIAARRLDRHPDSPFVALDIARRDRPLRRLAAALEGETC